MKVIFFFVRRRESEVRVIWFLGCLVWGRRGLDLTDWKGPLSTAERCKGYPTIDKFLAGHVCLKLTTNRHILN